MTLNRMTINDVNWKSFYLKDSMAFLSQMRVSVYVHKQRAMGNSLSARKGQLH